MKGEAQSLNWISDDRLFEIPFFQRPYVWKDDNWDELWNNIVLSSDSGMPFIGSFILQEKDNFGLKKYTVIDGQQRLTTLSILIKAFLDCSNDLKNDIEYEDAIAEIEDFIKYKEKKDMRTIKKPRINPSSIDKEDFLSVMNGVGIATINNNSHLILRCYKYFVDKFSMCSQSERVAIGGKFRSYSKFFIAIILDPQDDEQKIFDSVNRLGMKLLNSDIIKNNIYQRLRELATDDIDVLEIYNKNWEDIYQKDEAARKYWDASITIGRNKGNQLDEFLKDYATIKGIYVASQTGGIDGLSKAFKDYAYELNLKELISFIEEITAYAKTYYSLFNKNIQNIPFDNFDDLNVLLLTLKVTNISTFNPYILKLVHENSSNKTALLRNLQKFVIERLIYNASVKNYNKICEKLLKTTDAIDYLENYSEDSIDYNVFPSGLLKIKNENAKLLLFCIELIRREKEGASKFSTLINYSRFQLEHIMPRKWKNNWNDVPCYDVDDSIVTDIISKEIIRNAKINSIGNMTILVDKLNNSISNSDFKSKIKGNQKHPGIEKFVGGLLIADEIVKHYNEKGEWNEKYIFERDKKIFDELNEFFNFTSDSNNISFNKIGVLNDEPKAENEIIDFNDESTWGSVPYRTLAFLLVKKLIDDNRLSEDEKKLLTTQSYTKSILGDIRNPLLCDEKQLLESEWKKSRYSKTPVLLDGKNIYINNQFTKDILNNLIGWYKKHY